MADPKVNIKVNVDGAAGVSQIQKLKDGLLGVLGSIPGVSSGLGLLASGAAAAAAVFAALGKAVGEYAAAQEGVSKLAAALGQVGQLTRENVDGFQELASELQKTTAIADDEWIGVLTKLVQFGAKPESIGLHVEAVKNLAGIVGDLGSATNLYARALQGNYEAFGRYGIRVEEAGTQTERLERLQRQLADRGAGQLEASASSLTGQFRALGLVMSDVFEAAGRGVAKTGVLQWSLSALTLVAEGVAEALGGPVEAIAGITNRVQESARANNDYAETLKQIAIASERVRQSTDEEIVALRRRQQAIDELSDAQMALDLAGVDEAVASGRMSPVQGIRSRSGIRRGYARAKFEREQNADMEEQRRLEQEFADQSQLLESVRGRRKAAERIPASGPLTTIGADAAKLVADLQRERAEQVNNARVFRATYQLGRPMAKGYWDQQIVGSETRVAEIDQRIKEVLGLGERGPQAMASRAEEAARLRAEEDVIAKRVDDARSRARGSDAVTRSAIRARRFGFDEQREDVESRSSAASASRAAAERLLRGSGGSDTSASSRGGVAATRIAEAVDAGSQAMMRAAETSARTAKLVEQIRQDTDRRLAAIEASAKNAANR